MDLIIIMCFANHCQSPPTYSSRGSTPAYSSRPGPEERTLEQTRRRVQSPPTGMCIKRVENITLVLLGQEDNVELPHVAPGTRLHGSVLLEHPENVKSVVLKIDGLLETVPLAASYTSIPLFCITNKLYTNEGPSSPPTCPHNFAFSHPFPSVFRHNEKLHPLPPTCHMSFGNSVHFVKCAYRITATVVSARHRRASFLTKSDQVSFELNYRPQTRPSQPLISNPSLVDTVKLCPEEWVQCPKVVNISSLPVLCDLFFPSIRAFCVEDPIPFHLQLSSVGTAHPKFFRSADPPLVKVRLVRKVAMTAGDRMAERSIILGEGTLQPFDPVYAEGTLNWQGEARCRDPASVVGTFDCGTALAVTDMLVVEISPPHSCPIQSASFGYSIKLTTHRWDYYA